MVLKKNVDDLTKQVNKFANTAQRLDAMEERIGELAFRLNAVHITYNLVVKKLPRSGTNYGNWRVKRITVRKRLQDEFLCEH